MPEKQSLDGGEHGAVARVLRAAVATRDKCLELAEAQSFDDATFHALQAEACAWQVFAEALLGSTDMPAMLKLRGFR